MFEVNYAETNMSTQEIFITYPGSLSLFSKAPLILLVILTPSVSHAAWAVVVLYQDLVESTWLSGWAAALGLMKSVGTAPGFNVFFFFIPNVAAIAESM